MTRIYLFCFALLVATTCGCMHIPERYSQLEAPYPRDGPQRHLLTLHTPPGTWGVGGQSVSIDRVIDIIEIELPRKPSSSFERYAANELVVDDVTPFPAKPILVTGGLVEIDVASERAIVKLSTNSGEFWGNGLYPLRLQ